MISLGSSIYVSDDYPASKHASCKVDPDLVAEFNRLLLQDSKPSLPAERDALRLLDGLFGSLVLQSKSALESAVFAELHKLCSGRLKAEFNFKASLSASEFDTWSNSRVAHTTNLSKFWLGILKCLTFHKKRVLQNRVQLGFRDRTDLTVDSGLTVFLTTIALRFALKRAGVFDNLSSSYSTKMKVVGAALEISAMGSSWWKSSNQNSGGVNTDYAHYDEAIEHPKAIVYLSNVSANSGPTEYFPGLFELLKLTPLQELVGRVVLNIGSDPRSPTHPYFRGHRQRSAAPVFRDLLRRLPMEMRFNSHFGWDIPPTHALQHEFSVRRVQVLGAAGATLVFDGGRVVHRGGLLQSGERIVIQVVFGRARGGLLKSVFSRLGRN